MNHTLTRRTLLTVTALGAIALTACERKTPVTYHGIDLTGATYATDIRLSDPDGKERTLADFRGKAILIFFGFTQCPDVCPTALTRAAEVKRLLGPDGERLQTLFITVDPERDTPEVLKAYTAAFDPSFIGLYGDLERTAQTAKDFKVYYKKVPTGATYTMDHTSLSYVYDPQGKLRLALRHEQPAQDCAEDIRKLLKPA
ncbi:SCO family protein [Comamonas testosteroni]|uniref:SCO family protein n=1 Tax=Comamonas testosteroni TaxID=285 RepID=UPI0009293FF5|nr:SCO family protein [Comamonas testosteroni]OJX23663.1 MAG: SCO family protein [Burkholderiales bacterium 68-20]WEE77024.1 SCO family protein [Comamonas testosteroni]